MEDQLLNIVCKQREYFKSHVTFSLEFRVSMLLRLKESLLIYKNDISYALKDDLGRHEFESFITETSFCLDEIEFTLDNLEAWMEPEEVKNPKHLLSSKSTVYFVPKGICLIIGAYNLPFHLVFMPLIAAIAAGNTAIVKPSELSCKSQYVIKKIIESCFDEKYVSCVLGDENITSKLLELKYDHIFFTGSPRVGSIIMQAAAKNITPVTLELGGKSPCIINNDVDLMKAAKKIAYGKYLNAGQICNAPDYLIIHEDIHDDFITYLDNAIRLFYGDDPYESFDYSRIISVSHFDRILSLIDKEKVAIGGKYVRDNRYISPTVLINVSLEDRCMQEEIFGPVLPVIKYSDINDVVEIFDAVPGDPLAVYVFSENEEFQEYVITKLKFGGGCINDCVVQISNPYLPFCGTGSSGIGAYHGVYGFEEFTHKKSIVKSYLQEFDDYVFPPYERSKLESMGLDL